MAEYIGNFHIHSLHSDGHKNIKDIASIAAKSGLDFIVISDHGTLEGRKHQGYQDGVLVLVGMEINDAANHYLAMDIDEEIPYHTDCPQKVIDEVNRLRGFGVIAHPFEKGSPCYENRRTYPWLDWNVNGFQGIEIWNFLSQWRDGITGWGRGIWLLLNPIAGLLGPYDEVMAQVDHYQQQGKQVMIYGGSDAHGTLINRGLLSIKIAPYDLCFKMINIHIITETVLTGDEHSDVKMVYAALREGRSWVACDYNKSSRGFKFELRNNEESWLPGSEVSYRKGMYFLISTPFPARVKLIKNGANIYASYGTRHIFRSIDSGVYRAEAAIRYRLKYRPWIFTNSIWIK